MNQPPNPADYLKSSVALIAGVQSRRVALAATTDLSRIPKYPPGYWLARVERPPISAVVDVFLKATELGCFTAVASGTPRVLRHDKRQTGHLVHEEWEVAVPAIPEGAFDTLLRTAEAASMSPNGLTTFSVVEQAPSELPRIGREALHPLGAQLWPFPVDNEVRDARKDMSILMTFVDDVSQSTLEATRVLFETWGRILKWGGFPPNRWSPCSTGFVTDVSRQLPEELVAEIEFFTGAAEAWHALCRGLLRVHTLAPVRAVEIG
jgi:hypothetical protein